MLEKVSGPECPDCGCQASRVFAARLSRSGSVERGTVSWWRVERRECDHCGAEFTVRIETARPAGEPDRSGNGGPVPFACVRCPLCDSRDTPVQRTVTMAIGVLRYHACRGCGVRFKSLDSPDEIVGPARVAPRSLRRKKDH